jgi:hypothetical protein|tara:strand:- start:230 stop:649 length:420 start_codon:yes stop_codon:yes gene_type:complete
MSWSTCYKGSNNIYSDFPAMMSDGRVHTEHDTSCDINNELQKSVGIKNNYDYRQYLINNGLDIISQNTESSQENSNVKLFADIANTSKYLFKSMTDTKKPFGYEESDLKNLYLSRKQLNSKMTAPFVTQEELLKQRSRK